MAAGLPARGELAGPAGALEVSQALFQADVGARVDVPGPGRRALLPPQPAVTGQRVAELRGLQVAQPVVGLVPGAVQCAVVEHAAGDDAPAAFGPGEVHRGVGAEDAEPEVDRQ